MSGSGLGSGNLGLGTVATETDFKEYSGVATTSTTTTKSYSVDAIVEAYKLKLDNIYKKIIGSNGKNDSIESKAKDIRLKYENFLKKLSKTAVCYNNSPHRLTPDKWNRLEGTMYEGILKLGDRTTQIVELFYNSYIELLKLFQEQSLVTYPTLEAISTSNVPDSSGSVGKANTGGSNISNTPSGGDTYNIIGGTTGPSYTEEDIRRMFEEWMKDKENDPGTTQCECSCSPELLALLKQLTDLLNGITNNPNGVTNDEPTEGETTPSGTDVPITGAGTEDINGTTTPADDSGEGSGDNTDNEKDYEGEDPETPPEDINEDLTPDEVTPGEEEENKESLSPVTLSPGDSNFDPNEGYEDDSPDDNYPDTPDDGYTNSYVDPFDNIPDNPDNPNNPYDPDDPNNDNKEPSGGTVNETPTPPPSRYPSPGEEGGSTVSQNPNPNPGPSGEPGEPSTKPDPDPEPGVTGDEPSPTPIPSTKPDNPSQPPSGGTTDWGGAGSTGTGGTPGGTTGGDDPFAKDRDPNVSVENVGKEWVTLGGAATGAGAAAGVVGGYGGGSYGNYYATNTGNTTGDTSSTTQFAGTTDDEEKKKKAKYIFSSEQAEVENPYEGMEPDSLYGNNVVYDTLEPNSNGNATDTTSMDADGTNLGTILGIGGISAGLGVGGLYMAQAKKDAKKEEEEKKKKEQEEKDAESLGLVGGVMASSFIEDDDDDDKKKKKKQNNRSFFN